MKTTLRNLITSPTIKKINHDKTTRLISALDASIKMKVPYPMKTVYNCVVPPNLFQTWHTKNLPPLMASAVNKLRQNNPRFNYQLYDDNDCREFIKNNFDGNILNAFDGLIPGAYKADLWRYCVLYKLGGIYLDIKYTPSNHFKLINLLEKEHFCLDIDNNGIYNAIIVAKPGNPILLQAINQIEEHVRNKYYGNRCLEPTGPELLARYFSREDKNRMDLKHNFHLSLNYRFILFNNYYIFKSYTGYLDEHSQHKKVEHYSILWNNKAIYH
jgi:mannosyltransferase OCH1-like enzyme